MSGAVRNWAYIGRGESDLYECSAGCGARLLPGVVEDEHRDGCPLRPIACECTEEPLDSMGIPIPKDGFGIGGIAREGHTNAGHRLMDSILLAAERYAPGGGGRLYIDHSQSVAWLCGDVDQVECRVVDAKGESHHFVIDRRRYR